MPDPDEHRSLKELDKRIKDAKAQRESRLGGQRYSGSQSGLGLGLRIATEMVSALAVGVVIGIVLDSWLGTKPWLLIVFFILGAAAAFMNMIRTAQAVEAARKQDAARDGEASGERRGKRGADDREG